MITENPLRICMLSDDFLPAATGVGSHLQAVTTHLAALGHAVTIVTTRHAGQPEAERWRGVKVFRVPSIRMFGYAQAMPSVKRLQAIFEEVRPDVVHHHYLGTMLQRAMKAARALGLPQVYTYHMTEEHLTQPLPMRPFRKLIARKITDYCNRMDLVISVSRNLAKKICERGVRTPIRTISNPVDFGDASAVQPAARNAPHIVMFAGRLHPEKNIPFLLRGFQRMLVSEPEAALWIAGEGPHRKAIEAIVTRLGLRSKVEFLGFLDHAELTRRYAACDTFVLPSLVETQGLVAMEAMWFSKPVVVARSVVSATELVDEGVNGFIVDETSDAQLAERLVRLARDPALRARMGSAGREKTAAFRSPVVVRALEAAYRQVLPAMDLPG